MTRKRIICKSGIKGWECKLRDNYEDFEEFEAFSNIYGIAERLGFYSSEEAWEVNPLIRGSVIPDDLECVFDRKSLSNCSSLCSYHCSPASMRPVLAKVQAIKLPVRWWFEGGRCHFVYKGKCDGRTAGYLEEVLHGLMKLYQRA